MSFQKSLIVNNNTIKIIWSDAELNLMKRFTSYANKLIEMIKRKDRAFATLNMNISIKENQLLEYIVNLPDKDNISILLHNLRPFILQDEATNLNRILNLLSREISEIQFREYIKQQKNIFNTTNSTLPFELKVNQNKVINSEKVLKLWLNAYEYHRDEEKIKEIENLIILLPFDVFEFIMIDN